MKELMKRIQIKDSLEYKSYVNVNKIVTNSFDFEDQTFIKKRKLPVSLEKELEVF